MRQRDLRRRRPGGRSCVGAAGLFGNSARNAARVLTRHPRSGAALDAHCCLSGAGTLVVTGRRSSQLERTADWSADLFRPRETVLILPSNCKRLVGSKAAPLWPPSLVAPTVLAPGEAAARASREEIFGPIAAVHTVHRQADCGEAVNERSTAVGSVWTRDGARALRMTRAIETGVISVNSQQRRARDDGRSAASALPARGASSARTADPTRGEVDLLPEPGA